MQRLTPEVNTGAEGFMIRIFRRGGWLIITNCLQAEYASEVQASCQSSTCRNKVCDSPMVVWGSPEGPLSMAPPALQPSPPKGKESACSARGPSSLCSPKCASAASRDCTGHLGDLGTLYLRCYGTSNTHSNVPLLDFVAGPGRISIHNTLGKIASKQHHHYINSANLYGIDSIRIP